MHSWSTAKFLSLYSKALTYVEHSSIEEIFHHSKDKRHFCTFKLGCTGWGTCWLFCPLDGHFFIQFLIFLGLTLYFYFSFLVFFQLWPHLPCNFKILPSIFALPTNKPPAYVLYSPLCHLHTHPPTHWPACLSAHPQTYPRTYLPTHSPIHFPTCLSLMQSMLKILRKIKILQKPVNLSFYSPFED